MKIENTFWEQREVISELLYLQAPEGSPEGESEQEFISVCMNFRSKFGDKEVDLHNGCVADVTAPGPSSSSRGTGSRRGPLASQHHLRAQEGGAQGQQARRQRRSAPNRESLGFYLPEG